MSWGIYFAAYNRAKARYQRRSSAAKLGPGMHLAAAAEAGALVREYYLGMPNHLDTQWSLRKA